MNPNTKEVTNLEPFEEAEDYGLPMCPEDQDDGCFVFQTPRQMLFERIDAIKDTAIAAHSARAFDEIIRGVK